MPAQLKPSNRLDEYSSFRKHFQMARLRALERRQEFSITLEDLRNQWDRQEGLCPITGWQMENPRTVRDWNHRNTNPRRASLDRIDSSKGYSPDNIQFVSVMANYAKNNFTLTDLIEFGLAIARRFTAESSGIDPQPST
jgi:hypothetical protein